MSVSTSCNPETTNKSASHTENSWLAGRALKQVFSQASGTGDFVATQTSGSFDVRSSLIGYLIAQLYEMPCCLISMA